MKLNKFIDHTLLSPDATRQEIIQLCQEAKEYNFMSVCINPTWVELAADELYGSDVKVCTVIGFPLGANLTSTKVQETQAVVELGASEVDMVLNIGAVKSKDWALATKDIQAVVEAAGEDVTVKVIIETCLLTDEEKIKACKVAKRAGADFVKTSTGFSTGGATVADIALMREAVGPDLGVKASGGVGDKETADAMIEAGATRIGASKGIQIVAG